LEMIATGRVRYESEFEGIVVYTLEVRILHGDCCEGFLLGFTGGGESYTIVL
jgi:hypothetical protein